MFRGKIRDIKLTFTSGFFPFQIQLQIPVLQRIFHTILLALLLTDKTASILKKIPLVNPLQTLQRKFISVSIWILTPLLLEDYFR